MPFQSIKLRPGIVRNITNLSNEGGWWAGNNIRFWFGFPRKLGGWARALTDTFAGVVRNLITWQAFSPSNELIGLGSSSGYYLTTAGAVYDITPIVAARTLANNPLSTTIGTNVVRVSDPGHGFSTGQLVKFTGATAVGGVPAAEINQIQLIHVVDAVFYDIKVTTLATSTVAAGGGAAVAIEAYLYPGDVAAVVEGGWGAPPWGTGGWGSEYADAQITALPATWSHDTFGNDLFINPRGGAIYYWAYNSGAGLNNRAVELSTLATVSQQPWVPNNANYILTSDLYNFLLAYGVNPDNTSDPLDPLFIRWSDQNNFFDWQPTAANQAGGIRLSGGTTILCALKMRQETVIFTDTAVYVQQYIGPPLTFSFTLISDNTSLIGPNAAIVYNGVAYWMGAGRFYRFDGALSTIVCPICDEIFANFNTIQSYQTTCGYNERYGEIWWHYASVSSIFPDSYVIYNTVDNVWTYGTMGRTAWRYSPFRQLPLAAKRNDTVDEWGDPAYTSTLLLHEVGCDDASTGTPQPISAYAETADFDIAEGNNFAFVDKVIPDVDFTGSTGMNPSINFSIDVRNNPGNNYGDETPNPVVRSTTVPVQQFTPMLYVRVRGRQVKFRISSDSLGVAWHWGTPRLNIRMDGRQ